MSKTAPKLLIFNGSTARSRDGVYQDRSGIIRRKGCSRQECERTPSEAPAPGQGGSPNPGAFDWRRPRVVVECGGAFVKSPRVGRVPESEPFAVEVVAQIHDANYTLGVTPQLATNNERSAKHARARTKRAYPSRSENSRADPPRLRTVTHRLELDTAAENPACPRGSRCQPLAARPD